MFDKLLCAALPLLSDFRDKLSGQSIPGGIIWFRRTVGDTPL